MDSKRIYEKGEENVSGERVAEFWFDGGACGCESGAKAAHSKGKPKRTDSAEALRTQRYA